jgi:hypothetical protein
LTTKIGLGYEGGAEVNVMDVETTSNAGPSQDAGVVVRKLVSVGEKLPASVRDRIVALGPAAVPPLLEIFNDTSLHPEDSPGQGWAPIHAVKLLELLRATEAIDSLISTLAETTFDEIINGRIVQALEAMGQAALEPVLDAYAKDDDRDFRSALSSVLAGLKVKDERIFAILLDELAAEPGFAAGRVAEYGDPRAIPPLVQAFDNYEVKADPDNPLANQDMVEIKAAIEDLGGKLNDIQQARFDRAMKPADEWRAKFNAALEARSRGESERHQKLSRNDLCHCGSGKKYKKCHLTSDEETERTKTAKVNAAIAELREQKAQGRGPAQQMVEFAQPLIDATDGDMESVNRAMSLGMLFWNLAIIKDPVATEEALTDIMAKGMKPGTDEAEFRLFANDMIERHRKMFPEMHQ